MLRVHRVILAHALCCPISSRWKKLEKLMATDATELIGLLDTLTQNRPDAIALTMPYRQLLVPANLVQS